MDYTLTYEEAEALDLDGSGTYKYHELDDEQKAKFWAHRATRAGLSHDEIREFASLLHHVAHKIQDVVEFWHEHDLDGDYIVPELGLPISMSLDEASVEIGVLSADMDASSEYHAYVGRHRRKVGVSD